jgi:hypothetical protein
MDAFLEFVCSSDLRYASFQREQLQSLLQLVCRAYVSGRTQEALSALLDESLPCLAKIILQHEGGGIVKEVTSNLDSSSSEQMSLREPGWQAVSVLYLMEELTVLSGGSCSICASLMSFMPACIMHERGQHFAFENKDFLWHFIAFLFRLDQLASEKSGGNSLECLEFMVGQCQQEFGRMLHSETASGEEHDATATALWPCHLLNLVCSCVSDTKQPDVRVGRFLRWLESQIWDLVLQHLNDAATRVKPNPNPNPNRNPNPTSNPNPNPNPNPR